MKTRKQDSPATYGEHEFTVLVEKHKGTIYTVCYMFSKNNDEINDLFQEVLINIWNGLNRFEGKSDIRTWIYRIALNTCISIERKNKRRKTIPLDMDINLYEDTDSDTRQVKMLYDRINRLKPFDRAIILLWLENIPYDEIGDIVGISAKNVSVKLSRIRDELKNNK
ncbi:RNA polymerase sigma factor [Xylanibacter muris]|uniref:Sigma-70 family RNA polymerase sigma factor n=1 Tax=Xylanibacter muris TaxID=2736290 RepID=A0ABX2AIV1_9BACT|nr:sigma-70 family RNA polymerase sigma factor [Xylanibacter muris]NPD90936.1 sigma-70 family RNA polymerase sigma factor [Xylanibacter muris]